MMMLWESLKMPSEACGWRPSNYVKMPVRASGGETKWLTMLRSCPSFPPKFSAALKILPEECRFIRFLVNYWLKPTRRKLNGIRRLSIDEIGNAEGDISSLAGPGRKDWKGLDTLSASWSSRERQ